MDINSLLSPSETPRSSSTAPATSSLSPHTRANRALSLTSKYPTTASPLQKSMLPASSVPPHLLSPKLKAASSSPRVSPSTTKSSGASSLVDQHQKRASSTPSMDTLAEAASMQNHQLSRGPTPALRQRESYESQLSPSTIFPTVANVGVSSKARASFDVAALDSSKASLRVDFTGTSLPLELQQSANRFATYLNDNPAAYDSHVEMIKILHQGFIHHVYPPSSPNDNGDPSTYDLLPDLRNSREDMDRLFAVGEELWVDWIQDESMLARSIEERIGVMEKCLKAVEEEFGSTKLWLIYGEWVTHCYNAVQDTSVPQSTYNMSDEDRMIGREAFTWQMVLDTWQQAAANTKNRMNDSHQVWDRYIEFCVEEAKRQGTKESLDTVRTLFEQRLQTPHANWDSTSQAFSSFVSHYLNSDYEEIMVEANRNSAEAKRKWAIREVLEAELQRAQDSGDRAAEYMAFAQYIQLEKNPEKRKRVDFDLTNAAYQRAELRFPSDPKIWEDHIMFLLEQPNQGQLNAEILATLDRSTRHCPWSGSLWSQYLLTSEIAGQAFTQTEEIKHKATNTGLLDVRGMEEVLKVHTTWCSYLRRRAFRADATDEDLDVAEMGIRSSIENMQELANKKVGEAGDPDPRFRLERIYIKFMYESGSWDSAREVYRGLVKRLGESWEFWVRFYLWEMMVWGRFTPAEKSAANGHPKKTSSPTYATAVLKEALKQSKLDWPEKIVELLLQHCEDHEDAEELQLAIVETKKLEAVLATRRAREAKEAVELAAAQIQQVDEEQTERAEAVANGLHIYKRKRDDDSEHEESHKRPKNIQDSCDTDGKEPFADRQPARDREHATILVENLSADVTETRIRQYFKSCGTINSLKVLRQNGTSAMIEFDEKEAAVFAQSRNGKDFDGQEITIQLGSGSTLFVTNFPAIADETYIRNLFAEFGDIVDIRFPSLKYNTHRRFCYVQFKLNSQAQAATKLDGEEGNDGLKLVVKHSNPSLKQDRSGAMEDGREIYVRNVHWGLSEDELGAAFADYGAVESVRIPRNMEGKSKGFGFIVFASQDEANAALAMNGHKLRDRALHVEISSKTGAKRQATTVVGQASRAKSPSMEANGASPSAMSGTSANDSSSDRHARTIALLNVPDTVNDSRIRALGEKYGELVKISLRPDHQGAIIEFADTESAGRAALGLEGAELVPGRRLHVGTVPEMFKQKAEVKTDKIQSGQQGRRDAGKAAGPMIFSTGPGPIKRPGHLVGRREGGGGGLGRRRGGLGFDFAAKKQSASATSNGDGSVADAQEGKKSNDDFRSMLSSKE